MMNTKPGPISPAQLARPNDELPSSSLEVTKQTLIDEINRRVADKILEQSNADLLIKLINRADSLDEAISIATLGTVYKRTGLHFAPKLEKKSDTIKYFKKNEALSFHTDDSKPVHKLIIGDNYPALQNLLIQYRGKVDVIYIDPPYGKDSMGEFAKTNYDNAITRDNLLSMLYPRLQLAKMLLSDSGVIFCSIDDKNQAYVKCLFDEVFGTENFVATFIWEQGRKSMAAQVSINHEYCLIYCKNKIMNIQSDYIENSNWREKKQGLEEIYAEYDRLKSKYGNDYLSIEKGIRSFYKNLPDCNPSKRQSQYKCVDEKGLYFPGDIAQGTGKGGRFDILHPVTNKPCKVPTGGWRFGEEKLPELLENNMIFFGKDETTVPCLKRYLRETEYEVVSSVFYKDGRGASKRLEQLFGKKIFDFPKDEGIIKKFISLVTSYKQSNSIILDFFAGSGTTGHAVLDLNKQDGGNRTFILCQLNEITDTTPNGIAYDVTAKRLKRIMTGECYDGSKDFPWLKDNTPYGGNLDVYEIGTVANFESTEGKTPFDVIDETLYGKEKFNTVKEKIDWVCQNFDKTQKYIEGE